MFQLKRIIILCFIFGYLTPTTGFLEFFKLDPIEGEGDENFNTLATPSMLYDTTDAPSCQAGNNAAGFKLFTRYSRNEGECMRLDFRPVTPSYFNASQRTVFFIHGYLASGDDWYVNDLKNSLIDKEHVNFVAVDWSVGSWQLPMFAMMETDSVAAVVSGFIRNLTAVYGVLPWEMHVMGHSLGARVTGAVGRNLKGALGRITVLDPVPGDYRGSAGFVDVIHATFLSDWAAGDVQFFPNNGRMTGVIPWSSAHINSVYLYQQSVEGPCQFKALNCDSYKQFTNHECDNNAFNYMGHHASSRLAHGKLFLTINNDAPFCDVTVENTSSKT